LCAHVSAISYINGRAQRTPENKEVPMPKRSTTHEDSIASWGTRIPRTGQYREKEPSPSTLESELCIIRRRVIEDRTASFHPSLSSGTKKHPSLPLQGLLPFLTSEKGSLSYLHAVTWPPNLTTFEFYVDIWVVSSWKFHIWVPEYRELTLKSVRD